MPLVLLDTVLVRAPLLGIAALDARGGAGAELARTPLGRLAIELASPSLARALDGKASAEARAARDRYGRRAATRPTPHGLLAGVATGSLGAATRLDSGTPEPRLTPTWARLAAIGRAAIGLPAVREHLRPRVRRAPSVMTDDFVHRAVVMGPDVVRVERERVVDAVLVGCDAWTAWDAAAGLALDAGASDGHAVLESLLDAGLLAHDCAPPLVGPEPFAWFQTRFGALYADFAGDIARALAAWEPFARPPVPGKARSGAELAAMLLDALAAIGGGDRTPTRALHPILRHRPVHATLSRPAVERAAGLAALLFRLQDALHSPAAERQLDPSLAGVLEAVDAVAGPGAIAVRDLALGRFGVTLDGDAPSAEASSPAALLSLLATALASGAREVALDPDDLDAVLPAAELPRTFELILSPAREPRGAAPGTHWLLGLHGPAGATWGRFAHTLGTPLKEALARLDALERTACPGEERLDVAWTPTSDLADAACHPPVRARALALAAWPDGDALTASELELIAEPSRAAPLLLRAGGRVVAPAPLTRLRSTTAPPGVERLLLGWSLVRQHAPWAFVWPAALDVPRTPRLTLDGFVIAPASWRLPAARDRRALGAWRRASDVPRWVLVGHEDELLAVDLARPDAVEDLDGHDRVVELWPPPDRLPDRAGRRVEAVVAVVDVPDDDERADAVTPAARLDAAAREAARAPRIPAPADAPPVENVMTFKLYGPADAQDRLLSHLAPALAAAGRKAGPLAAWWFQRFVEPPGARAHLRLRVAAREAGGIARIHETLTDVLDAARAAGDLVDFAATDYRRELGRFGADAPAIDRVFASESRLVVELLLAARHEVVDPLELAVRAADALASGLGLDLVARHDLATRLRGATARDLLDGDRPVLDELRARRGRLDAALLGTLDDAAAPIFAAHARRLARLRVAPAHLPVLVHLGAVRLAGPAPALEAASALAWERTLASLRARRR